MRLFRTEKEVIFFLASPHSSTIFPRCTIITDEEWMESAYLRATDSFSLDQPASSGAAMWLQARPGTVQAPSAPFLSTVVCGGISLTEALVLGCGEISPCHMNNNRKTGTRLHVIGATCL
jgi:hypothetical protein